VGLDLGCEGQSVYRRSRQRANPNRVASWHYLDLHGLTSVVNRPPIVPPGTLGATGPAVKTFLYKPKDFDRAGWHYVMDFYPVGLGTSIIWRVDVNGSATAVAPITGSVVDLIALFADPNLLLGKLVTRTVKTFTGAGPRRLCRRWIGWTGSPPLRWESSGRLGAVAPTRKCQPGSRRHRRQCLLFRLR